MMSKTFTLYQADAVRRAEFEALLTEFSFADRTRIMQAYRLSKYGHKGVNRRGGDRYFEHPKAVAVLLLRRGEQDADVICAALLHDIIEDTFILLADDVEAWFGARVRRIVDLVSKVPHDIDHEEYFARLAESDEPGAWLVKLADRVHNLSTLLDSDDPAKQAECRRKKIEQVEETRDFIRPLAVALSECPGYKRRGQVVRQSDQRLVRLSRS